MPLYSSHSHGPELQAHLEAGAVSLGSEPPVEPRAPVDQFLQRLLGAAEHVGEGVVLGLLAAPLMRHRHLHWSWAAAAFALILAARGALGPLASTLATAALTAAVRGRRWHREDHEAGADLTDIARERFTPLDGLRSVLRLLGSVDLGSIGARGSEEGSAGPGGSRQTELGHRARFVRGELVVGEDRRSRPVSLPLHDVGGGVHTLVLGATGSGKTVTQTLLATATVQREMAVVVVDPKEDSFMRSELERAARVAGQPFIAWTPEGPTVYNPFAHGSPTEIADRALAGERFTEPHYLRQAQRYLGFAVRSLRACGRVVSLAELVAVLDPEVLGVLERSIPDPARAQEVHDYLGSLSPRQLTDLGGMRDRLAIMAESDIAPWLDPRTGGLVFDLPGALRERAVVYFGLRADQRPLVTEMLGAAIVQDLLSTAAGLQGEPVPSLVALDEFSALGAEHVTRLFGRARSAGMSLVLGTQELSDLRAAGHDGLLEQILGNLTTLVAHRQVVPDSADLVARLAGTRGAWQVSVSSSGQRTRTRVREYRFSPQHLLDMPRGCAAVFSLTGCVDDAARVRIARMFSPQR
jgi:TraM recognition site of TraD and TraG/Helicase HerA, central domain